MAFTEEGMVMPVSPMGGNAFGGDGAWWIILLFILLIGGNGWGGNGDVQRGFDQAALSNGISNLGTQIGTGFAGVEQGANARQIANMQTAFAAQTAMTQGFNDLAAQFANCCCEQRLGTADLKYTVATENCADRAALSDGVRDIIASQTAGVQRILDQLCNDKIDAKNEKIADLERQLTMANLAASQTAQTSKILADNTAQTVALEQYLNPVPVPAYIVQNPACACNNTGCGSF